MVFFIVLSSCYETGIVTYLLHIQCEDFQCSLQNKNRWLDGCAQYIVHWYHKAQHDKHRCKHLWDKFHDHGSLQTHGIGVLAEQLKSQKGRKMKNEYSNPWEIVMSKMIKKNLSLFRIERGTLYSQKSWFMKKLQVSDVISPTWFNYFM